LLFGCEKSGEARASERTSNTIILIFTVQAKQ